MREKMLKIATRLKHLGTASRWMNSEVGQCMREIAGVIESELHESNISQESDTEAPSHALPETNEAPEET